MRNYLDPTRLPTKLMTERLRQILAILREIESMCSMVQTLLIRKNPMKEKKSTDYYVDLPPGIKTRQVKAAVARAAESAGLYVSHIGSYSRTKFPNSVHWHFKRDPKEVGLLDATFWDVKALLWLMIRHSEPDWVKDKVPVLIRALKRELRSV